MTQSEHLASFAEKIDKGALIAVVMTPDEARAVRRLIKSPYDSHNMSVQDLTYAEWIYGRIGTQLLLANQPVE